ncbi:unnamed protein product [Linum trigynum]|uniref:Uncharacterized protein n=1 Tax=Linum trigynum TaxID=586398 RepID=A0AAV2ESB1_9ROSI
MHALKIRDYLAHLPTCRVGGRSELGVRLLITKQSSSSSERGVVESSLSRFSLPSSRDDWTISREGEGITPFEYSLLAALRDFALSFYYSLHAFPSLENQQAEF